MWVCTPTPPQPFSRELSHGSGLCVPHDQAHPCGTHHDQPLGDLLGAAVAELPEARPVILLAVQVPILLVVLVGQGGPALTAPAAGDPVVTMSPSSLCLQCHPTRQPVPIHPMGLQTSCFPCFLPCCKATAYMCHHPQRAPGMPVLAGGAGTHGDTQGRDRHGEGGASLAWMCQPGHRHTEGRARLSQMHQTGHGHREGHATLVRDMPALGVQCLGCHKWDAGDAGSCPGTARWGVAGRRVCGGLFCRKVRPWVQWGLWISRVHRRVQGC